MCGSFMGHLRKDHEIPISNYWSLCIHSFIHEKMRNTQGSCSTPSRLIISVRV